MMTYAGFFGKMTAFAVKDAYGGLQEMPGVAETFGWFGEVGSMWVLLFAMMTTPILYIVGTLTFQQTVLPRMPLRRGLQGYGHNSHPGATTDGVACDACNGAIVVPQRFRKWEP
jgi:hypothetical protein